MSPEGDSTTTRPDGSGLRPWRWPLHWQILLGLALGGLLGYLSGVTAVGAAAATGEPTAAVELVTGRWDFLVYDLGGDLFLNALKLIIVPIVVSSIVLAVASIGSERGFGRLGFKTLGYYIGTSLIAILTGLALVNLIAPGINDAGQGILVGQDISTFAGENQTVSAKAEGRTATSFLDVFREMVPDNVFASATNNGKLLGLIVVSLVVGYFITRVSESSRDALLSFTQGVYELTLMITDFVLRLAPLGVGFLLAATIAEQYAKLAPEARFGEFLRGIVVFALTALGALLVHFLVAMPLILMLVARVNPLRHYRAMLPALLTAFSTASSSATLPVTMDCVEERAGVSRKTTSFVLPLGATVNMDGTALYECVAAIFICQAFGIDLSIGQQFFIVLVALLTSIGVAGVPSASIVAIVLILQTISNQPTVQTELQQQGVASLTLGLGLIWLFDRPLDMCRTAVNIFSDSVGAVVIARTEGEIDVLVNQ
ncbi:MAG: dicarboxylate/amino acid:cation symporter [Planctomycetota bacterium]